MNGFFVNDSKHDVNASIVGSLPKSEMEIFGPTIAERPLVSEVPIGCMYEAVTTQEFWQSDGTNWVVC